VDGVFARRELHDLLVAKAFTLEDVDLRSA